MATELYTVDAKGTATFHFHPGQLRAWDSDRRFVFIFAGTQGGKTSFLPWLLWREITRTADPAGGENDYIAATASYDLFKLKLLPSIRECFEYGLRWGRYWPSERIMELADPSTGKFWANHSDDRMWGRIVLRSAVAGGGLESLTARAALLDECGQDGFTLETWEAVLRRLSLHRGRVLAGTTPYNLGWCKTEVYDRWAGGDTDFDVIQFDSTLNPRFSDAEYERAKATMPPWRFAMFYRGMFSRPAGMIYDCWDDALHLVPDFPIPREWPRSVGIDFGAVNTSLIWLAQDLEKDVWYVYRESLEGGQATRDHVKSAERAARYENVIGWWGGAPSEDQQRLDWGQEGVGVMRPPISDVEGGIARVYGLLKPVRLRVFRSCRGLIDEIGMYRRKLDDNQQPTDDILDKRTFHRLDALRYVVSGVTGGVVERAPTIWR